jgi:hypothetical protein
VRSAGRSSRTRPEQESGAAEGFAGRLGRRDRAFAGARAEVVKIESTRIAGLRALLCSRLHDDSGRPGSLLLLLFSCRALSDECVEIERWAVVAGEVDEPVAAE